MTAPDIWGLDAETLEWQKLALCSGVEILSDLEDPFFTGYETNEQIAKSTDQICLHCPVMKQCLQYASDNRETGCFGGVYLDRGKVDRNKNAHKTNEIWAQWREKLSEL